MISNRYHGLFEWAVITVLVFGAGALAKAQAQESDSQDQDGQIIQIGPDRGDQATEPGFRQRVRQPGFPDAPPQEVSGYWIGIMGGTVGAVLRHHVDLPVGKGLIVHEIVPDSPAAEAGLELHDILVRANDIELDEMQDLVELVASEGEKQGQIAIEVLRHGQQETVWVQPAERPATAVAGRRFPAGPGFDFGPGGMDQNPAQDLLRRFGMEGGPNDGWQFRNFGPGVIVGGQQMSVAQLPNGASVKVEKRQGEATQITVERDGEVWRVEGDDPETIDQLPEDLRPFVERMLSGGGKALGIDPREFRLDTPNLPHWREGNADLQRQLNDLQGQLQELQKNLQRAEDEPAER